MTIDIFTKGNQQDHSIDSSGNATYTEEYIIRGTSDKAVVMQTLTATIQDNIEINNYSLQLVSQSITDMGRDMWSATVDYKTSSPQSTQGLESSYSFDISTEMVHISNGITDATIFTAPDQTERNFGSAINVEMINGKQDVRGIDIESPVFSYSIQKQFSGASITSSIINGWKNIAGKINSGAFRGATAGEVRFDGCRGTKNSTGVYDIEFRFSTRKSRTNFMVDEIAISRKRGWDYLWTYYEDVEDDEGNLTKKATNAYIIQVYEEASFSSLDFTGSSIGTIIPGSIS